MDSGDFSNDNFEMSTGFIKFTEMAGIENNKPNEVELIKPKKKSKQRIMIRVTSQEPINSNPLSLIHDLRPDLTWEFLGTDIQGKVIVSFRMVLKIGPKQFTGEGKTKKLAKYSAARSALSELYGINLPESSPGSNLTKTILINDEDSLLLDQKIADMIGHEVHAKSKQIFELLEETKKWNVLASVVLTKDNDPSWFDIICITTGTKCIKGDRLSMTGSTIHDSHAEVLARRCFIHYLFNQLSSLMDHNYQDRPEFILIKRDDGFGFKLKDGLKVNIFISTAPCGDARVFSPNEESNNDPHSNRLSRGLLRAKIEAGEGTIPVKKGRSQLTWDGVLQGEQRLQFMSCSDKIALWNVTGLQGSLLSHFIEPIYINSLVLGSLFCYSHLVRAIHGRLNMNFESDSLKRLPPSYKVNKNLVAKAHINDADFSRQVTRAPNYAINWIKGDTLPEVISCDSGKIHKNDDKTSRLTKSCTFKQFRTLLGRGASKLPTSPLRSLIPTIYRDAKTSAVDYYQARFSALQAFIEQNLGDWIQVPAEVDLFGL